MAGRPAAKFPYAGYRFPAEVITVLIVALAALLGFVSACLLHVERQRYAVLVGSCRNALSPALPDLTVPEGRRDPYLAGLAA